MTRRCKFYKLFILVFKNFICVYERNQ